MAMREGEMWIRLPCIYLEEMGELDDAQFGALIRAALRYAQTGVPVQLEGDARHYARRVMLEVDRAHEPITPNARPASGVSAVSYYLDRVNPSPSHMCLDELGQYERILGQAVCIRAIDTALDERRQQWSYIRAILRRCVQEGIRSTADWEARDARRTGGQRTGNPFLEMMRGGTEYDGAGYDRGSEYAPRGLPEFPQGSASEGSGQGVAGGSRGSGSRSR